MLSLRKILCSHFSVLWLQNAARGSSEVESYITRYLCKIILGIQVVFSCRSMCTVVYVGQLTFLLFVQLGDEEAREHLLAIPDDSIGRSTSISEDGSRRRKTSSHVSIQNLIEPKNNLLKSISLDVKAGQVYCIIGPSGSGKVKFLNIDQ